VKQIDADPRTGSIIVNKALEKGRELGFKPLTVAVLEAGVHLTALKREDGSSLLRPQIAGGKAWGALGMGFGGREFARGAAGNDKTGDLIGAVGISGDTSENDEACAVMASKRWPGPRHRGSGVADLSPRLDGGERRDCPDPGTLCDFVCGNPAIDAGRPERFPACAFWMIWLP
jgi:uncharacterized protein GlcG (DUF336 family)